MPKAKNKVQLPEIPEKLYFTIGEVAKLCALKPHVLRYWEQEFSQLSPSKRRGNRRYYQHKDVMRVRQIRSLLYENGFTIEGARQQLANEVKIKTTESSAPILSKTQILESLETILGGLVTA